MTLVAGIRSEFLVCPPLDYPLRLAFNVGFFGAPRINGQSGEGCCSDHFASVILAVHLVCIRFTRR